MAKFVEAIGKVEKVTGKVVETTGLMGPVHAAVCWVGKAVMKHEAKKQEEEYNKLKAELEKKKSEEVKKAIKKEYNKKETKKAKSA